MLRENEKDSSKFQPAEKPPAEPKPPEIKKVFVVDENLNIIPVEIPAVSWKGEGRIFVAEINNETVIVMAGSFAKLTNFAGFETQEKAEVFKKAFFAVAYTV
jgi:hypothetical protein